MYQNAKISPDINVYVPGTGSLSEYGMVCLDKGKAPNLSVHMGLIVSLHSLV